VAPLPKRLLAVAGLLALAACGGTDTVTSPSVMITDLVVGTGPTALPGDTVTVDYVGTLADGTTFDSSYDTGKPLSFRLGAGQVIKGWDQGVPGMQVGGKRRLTVPPELGYGSQAVGSIPANSTLVFEIELRSVKGKP
jgi:FKBP-type peptidyl-prolyl cis-trans isomerase